MQQLMATQHLCAGHCCSATSILGIAGLQMAALPDENGGRNDLANISARIMVMDEPFGPRQGPVTLCQAPCRIAGPSVSGCY